MRFLPLKQVRTLESSSSLFEPESRCLFRLVNIIAAESLPVETRLARVWFPEIQGFEIVEAIALTPSEWSA